MSSNGTKPRVAFFDFTSCEGCQLTVIDALQTYPELLEAVEIVNFREASSRREETYQVAFVEGSCTRERDEARLHRIRQQAALVVALGACAHLGGVNAIKNRQPLQDVREYVYGEKAHWYDTYRARPIDEVIAVDAVIPGCPIDPDEFVASVKRLLQGRGIELPVNPVCVECKLNENICLYERGQPCLGPITRAGCGARCPSYGYGCEGCRGLVPEPNMAGFRLALHEHGLTLAQVEPKLTLFLSDEVEKREITLEGRT